MNDLLLDKTLAYVNTARTAFGLPSLDRLPMGRRSSTRGCVIYNALQEIGFIRVGTSTISSPDANILTKLATAWGVSADPVGILGIPIPGILQEFIMKFDNGGYPELNSDPFAGGPSTVTLTMHGYSPKEVVISVPA